MYIEKYQIVTQLLLCFLSFNSVCTTNEAWIRRLLFNSTLRNYNRDVLPSGGLSNGKVVVNISLNINKILQVDERLEFIDSIFWVEYKWTDSRLSWNASLFEHTSFINAQKSEVWLPDIQIYNAIDMNYDWNMNPFPLQIFPNGLVTSAFPLKLRTSCIMDIQFFPFDQQICRIKFGSWSYPFNYLDVQNDSTTGDISNFVGSTEWNLIGFKVQRFLQKYDDDIFPDVSYFLIIRRQPLIYVIVYIIPVIIIVFISLTSFLAPPACGQRITLVMTNLLVYTVHFYFMFINWPYQSKVFSTMAIFYFLSFLMMLAVCFFNILTLFIYYKSEIFNERPSAAMEMVFINYIGPFWGITDMRGSYKKVVFLRSSSDLKVQNKTKCSCCFCNMAKYRVIHKEGAVCPCRFCNFHIWCVKKKKKKTEEVAEELVKEDADYKHTETQIKWRLIAIILDRCVGTILVITYILILLLIIMIPKNYSEDIRLKSDSY